MLGLLQGLCYTHGQNIFVLLNKTCHIVNDITSVVLNHKLRLVEVAGFLDVWVHRIVQVDVLESVQHVLIITIVAEATLLINKTEDGGRGNVLRLEEFKATSAAALIEVDIGKSLRAKLVTIRFNLQCDHVIVEVLLQFLIGIVDAKLLEAILFEAFKAKDVEKSKLVNVISACSLSDPDLNICIHL